MTRRRLRPAEGHVVDSWPSRRLAKVKVTSCWLILLGVCLAACRGCDDQRAAPRDATHPRPAKATKAPAPAPAEAFAPTGIVEGTVRVRGEVPVDPAFAARFEGPTRRPERCRPLTDEERRPVHRGTDGRTGDVLVTATFSTKLRVPTPPRRNRALLIRDCRLSPRVLAATRGDTLVIRNEDEYPFVPRVNPIAMGFMQALMQGQSRRIELDRGGVFEADCGFGAACGVTSIVVLYHGIHATSDRDGRFRVEGVPADVDVDVHAWHPSLRDASQRVRVTRGGTATIELVMEPAPVRERPVTPDAGGHPEDRPGFF